MSRCILSFLILGTLLTLSKAFTGVQYSPFMENRVVLSDSNSKESEKDAPKVAERGVSVDQDGKSNVWAIEPKMELDTKSDSEKTQGLLIGGVSFAAFAVGAGFVLTHLPDPNQF
mmetsp:Transcript_8427/g.9603  ORF Transcript_8427/g.9603 Transcript_8427/m.9603 type:complete len:115 (-) Transcript_8427:256-600(-)|eukprot:CAMPEP_0194146214 /NCGR_PEP_ID=MMETSP0152-20130528/20438_1 /TAXON_ID=1049557 /ORGANISM="Thalassiothrix antarctica, Strain L6-D1" /LENGTH=114 /DNA_ID=CAMNT_0038846691 /DNA_START=89 /DNA_END=433 /DNA_ORIENTATION=+